MPTLGHLKNAATIMFIMLEREVFDLAAGHRW